MAEEATKERFGHWAVLELMGHVRIAGYVTEEPLFGTALGRIDIPGPNGSTTTQYFGGTSVYRLTPCSEEIARAVAKTAQPTPVYEWDLRRQLGLPEPAETHATPVPGEWDDNGEDVR